MYAGWHLGGGYGPLTRKLGLGADNFLEVQMVLANGTLATANSKGTTLVFPSGRSRSYKASAKKPNELFWALRGGGGSTFGIITAITVRVGRHAPRQAQQIPRKNHKVIRPLLLDKLVSSPCPHPTLLIPHLYIIHLYIYICHQSYSPQAHDVPPRGVTYVGFAFSGDACSTSTATFTENLLNWTAALDDNWSGFNNLVVKQSPPEDACPTQVGRVGPSNSEACVTCTAALVGPNLSATISYQYCLYRCQ